MLLEPRKEITIDPFVEPTKACVPPQLPDITFAEKFGSANLQGPHDQLASDSALQYAALEKWAKSFARSTEKKDAFVVVPKRAHSVGDGPDSVFAT